MRLLLINEDTRQAVQTLRDLNDARFRVDLVTDREDGVTMAQECGYAVVIVAVNGPIAGFAPFCERLVRRDDAAPVLLLTASDAPGERAAGLDIGADDCLARPYDPSELAARVRALARRDRRNRARVLRVADLEIDTGNRRVTRGGKEIALSVREYELLEALVAHHGRVLTRSAIQERVWMCAPFHSNTVDAFIRLLRRKVDTGYPIKLIRTIHGLGYSVRS